MRKWPSQPSDAGFRRSFVRGGLGSIFLGLLWTGCFYGVPELSPTPDSSGSAGASGSAASGVVAGAGSADLGGDTSGGLEEAGGMAGTPPCVGADCAYRSRCADSTLAPRVFIGGQSGPYAVVANKTYVFWSDRDAMTPAEGRVRRREATGVATTVDLALHELEPGALALDASFVYWVSGDGGIARAAVDAAPGDGGASTVELVASGQRGPSGIAIDESYVYWLNRSAATVARIEKNAPRSAVKVLCSTELKPTLLTSDSTTLYWTTSSGFVESVPKLGGTPTELVTPDTLGAVLGNDALASFDSAGIAVDDTWVYFRARGLRVAPAKDDPGKLLRVHKDGTGLDILVDNSTGALGQLRIDDSKLYFTTGSLGGEVWRVDTDGTGLVLMNCQAEAFPNGITTAGNRAYWTNFTGATLVWAPK